MVERTRSNLEWYLPSLTSAGCFAERWPQTKLNSTSLVLWEKKSGSQTNTGVEMVIQMDVRKVELIGSNQSDGWWVPMANNYRGTQMYLPRLSTNPAVRSSSWEVFYFPSFERSSAFFFRLPTFWGATVLWEKCKDRSLWILSSPNEVFGDLWREKGALWEWKGSRSEKECYVLTCILTHLWLFLPG